MGSHGSSSDPTASNLCVKVNEARKQASKTTVKVSVYNQLHPSAIQDVQQALFGESESVTAEKDKELSPWKSNAHN